MLVHVIDRNGNVIDHHEDTPVCGEHFCDECGACLACYGADPCVYGGDHRWVIDLGEDT